MATFDQVAAVQNQLLRKALQGILLVAPYSTPALETISGVAGALTIPAGYVSLGKLSTDGAERTTDQEISALRGWGDNTDARRDVDSETYTMTVTAMETKKRVIELYESIDLTGVVPDTNGEITWDKPSTTITRDWRVLLLVKDVNKANGLDVYCGIHYPKANFSQNGSQTLQGGDSAMQSPLTATALIDDEAGTPVRTFWAGPGLAGLVDDMGFVA